MTNFHLVLADSALRGLFLLVRVDHLLRHLESLKLLKVGLDSFRIDLDQRDFWVDLACFEIQLSSTLADNSIVGLAIMSNLKDGEQDCHQFGSHECDDRLGEVSIVVGLPKRPILNMLYLRNADGTKKANQNHIENKIRHTEHEEAVVERMYDLADSLRGAGTADRNDVEADAEDV